MSKINTSPDTTFTLQSTAESQIAFTKSIFTASQLHPGKFQIRYVWKYQPDWIFAILIICIILITWSRMFYNKRMQQIFRAPFSKRFINQLSRDGNLFRERVSVALGIVFILVISLFLYEFNQQIMEFTFPRFMEVGLFWSILLIFIIFQAVKVALIRLLGTIFKTRETTNSYLLNMLVFALFSGPVLLVGLILHLYLKSVLILYLCLIILTLILIFKFVRGLLIGISLTKFSYLFLFVYLCSLEILPLLVIIKLFFNHANSAGG
ncbi:MAG: DUF4271 domain-containing protein [Bacteroidota bacterium]